METCGRFVEDEHRGLRLLLRQVISQLHTLVLSAREGRGCLPQFDITKPHVLQRLQLTDNLLLPVLTEELDRHIDGEVEDVMYVLSVEQHFEDVVLEAAAMTRLAFQYEVIHELHLDCHGSLALTLLTTTTLCVEREVLRRVAHLLGELLRSHEFANLVVCSNVSHRVAS